MATENLRENVHFCFACVQLPVRSFSWKPFLAFPIYVRIFVQGSSDASLPRAHGVVLCVKNLAGKSAELCYPGESCRAATFDAPFVPKPKLLRVMNMTPAPRAGIGYIMLRSKSDVLKAGDAFSRRPTARGLFRAKYTSSQPSGRSFRDFSPTTGYHHGAMIALDQNTPSPARRNRH